jgi:transitional endoplasmic reticulum ATPase
MFLAILTRRTGNGKTISIKAMMNTLYSRPSGAVPTLYVKTLANIAGPEYALAQIFGKARAEAPCYLVFEDLDSVVQDRTRSFFLNEVDGLAANDGICMLGSTNHLDRLDPGLARRPSRFDRKYYFPNPSFDERVAYAEFWRSKLAADKSVSAADHVDGDAGHVEFPKAMCKAIAAITNGFSFAYIQEAFVAALLVIAGRSEQEQRQDNAKCAAAATTTDNMEESVLVDSALGEYFVEHGGRPSSRGVAEAMIQERGITNDDNDDGNGDNDRWDKYVLWRELKKQVKSLRDEMGDGDDDQNDDSH